MFVKPAAGRRVRDPRSKIPLPDSGAEVSDSDSYWVRRLQDGDVVLVVPSQPTKKATTTKKE